MKIAVTADLHLTTREKNPERYHALEDILRQLREMKIERLVLAGDTFDQSSRNYAEFDTFCKSPENGKIRFLLLPGNHDIGIDKNSVTAPNLEIIGEPEVKKFTDTAQQLFFLPYVENKTMGEFVAAGADALQPGKWILIGHGDWTGGKYEPNPIEPGIYMPLTRTDIENYKPSRVILGHLHKPTDDSQVLYIGSPCGIDIRETGHRRFLILDLVTAEIESLKISTDHLYFNESFVVYPVEDEAAKFKAAIAQRIASWEISQDEFEKVRVQVKVKGYSSNKRHLQEIVLDGFSRFKFHNNGEPDLNEVYLADDANLADIAERVRARIEQIELQASVAQPRSEEILLKALHVIYGGQ